MALIKNLNKKIILFTSVEGKIINGTKSGFKQMRHNVNDLTRR